MSRHGKSYMGKKRINTITELQGVTFIRRSDLTNDAGFLKGVFHIENRDNKGFGLCHSSSAKHMEDLVKRGYKSGELFTVPYDECPKTYQICLPCYIAYNKRRKEMVFSMSDVMNLNGVNFIRESAVSDAIDDSVKKAIKDILVPVIVHTPTGVIVNGERYFKNERPMKCKEGEVRTIQTLNRRSILHPTKWGKKIFHTDISIKTTQVEYKVGMKVRIIIEE